MQFVESMLKNNLFALEIRKFQMTDDSTSSQTLIQSWLAIPGFEANGVWIFKPEPEFLNPNPVLANWNFCFGRIFWFWILPRRG
jgi:hypothetical protein